MMMMGKNQPWHMLAGLNTNTLSTRYFENKAYLAKSFYESCVPLPCHSHSGVDTASEGDVDDGHQDGDGLKQGEVLNRRKWLLIYSATECWPCRKNA